MAAVSGPPSPTGDAGLRDAIVKAGVGLIGFLTTGAGFITFLGIAGAAVTWVRLREARLPATQALQLVGINQLVADGAVVLAEFVAIGLIALAVVYVIDPPGRKTEEIRHGVAALAGAETLVAIWMAHASAHASNPGIFTAVVVVLAVAAFTISILPGDPARLPPENDDSRTARWQRWRAGFGRRIVTFVNVDPGTEELRAHKARAALQQELGLTPDKAPGPQRQRCLTWLAMGIVAVVAVLEGLAFWWLYESWVGWSVWVACGLAGFCFLVARANRTRFWPYGVSVFFSVLAFGIWLTVVRLAENPEMSPVALLRVGNGGTGGVVGLFIARTDDRYWLGAVDVDCANGRHPVRGTGRIFSVPRSQVVDDAIGASVALNRAGDRALVLLGELVDRQPPGGAPLPDATPTPTAGAVSAAAATPAAAPTAASPLPGDLTPDSPARVPGALAVTGKCLHLPPRLVRLDPATAAPGDKVAVIGSGFGQAGAVALNGDELTARSWADQTAVVDVPEHGARSGRVTVTTPAKGGRRSNAVVLTVKPNLPPVAAISARPLRPGSRVFVLDAGGSEDPESGPLKYLWQSGGGTIARSRSARYRLGRGATRAQVVLTVTDDHRKTGTARRTVRPEILFQTLLADQTFAQGSARLVPAARERLRRLHGRLVRLDGAIVRLDVSGYADFTGTRAFNRALSRRRARAVLTALRRGLRLPARRIHIHAYGEGRATTQRLDSPRRVHDRRVDVRVVFRGR